MITSLSEHCIYFMIVCFIGAMSVKDFTNLQEDA